MCARLRQALDIILQPRLWQQAAIHALQQLVLSMLVGLWRRLASTCWLMRYTSIRGSPNLYILSMQGHPMSLSSQRVETNYSSQSKRREHGNANRCDLEISAVSTQHSSLPGVIITALQQPLVSID